ncbi:hypothetical protein Q0N48_05040 [Corynebacterium ureicelerivorans]|uniref:hypothetical protein n=1 Tax=Corynebacterium ureicelerivorans TaxID=401472 RepID=UPI00264EE154|nr:hypothetical protein [Corynebacterium ureicelerivorans]MDN8605367.1 hypothetical protein [Corynebacterium ureicelerivorans]
MFPTMVSDPDDKNRRYTGEVGSQWPRPLQIGYYLCLIAAVLMFVIAFLTMVNGVPDRLPDSWMIEGADEELIDTFAHNLRVYTWGSIILGSLITSCCAYLSKGSKVARRWLAGFIGLAVFLQLASFFVGVAGWASLAVVVILVFALFFMFRPAANAYVDKRSGDVWEGVE